MCSGPASRIVERWQAGRGRSWRKRGRSLSAVILAQRGYGAGLGTEAVVGHFNVALVLVLMSVIILVHAHVAVLATIALVLATRHNPLYSVGGTVEEACALALVETRCSPGADCALVVGVVVDAAACVGAARLGVAAQLDGFLDRRLASTVMCRHGCASAGTRS